MLEPPDQGLYFTAAAYLVARALQAGWFPLPGHVQAMCCSLRSRFGVFAPRGMGVNNQQLFYRAR